MPCLLFPAKAQDRDIARKLWARLDVIWGYPRTHSADEPDVQIAPGASAPPYTESLFAAYVHDNTGAAALHGVGALVIDDPPAGMLRRRLTYAGTTRTLGQWLTWLESNRGWQRAASLPGQPEAWSLVAPRDGEAGSADGTPIAEGAE